jgi:sodium/hydrogen antiporter
LTAPGWPFIGWFGPRGLASVIFALLAAEELGAVSDEVVATIALTVSLSVLAHGITAGPLADRYARTRAAHSARPHSSTGQPKTLSA